MHWDLHRAPFENAYKFDVSILRGDVKGSAGCPTHGANLCPKLLDEAHNSAMVPLLTRGEERLIRRIAVLLNQLTRALHWQLCRCVSEREVKGLLAEARQVGIQVPASDRNTQCTFTVQCLNVWTSSMVARSRDKGLIRSLNGRSNHLNS